MDVGMLLPRVNPGNTSLTREVLFAAAVRLEAEGFQSAWLTDSVGRGHPTPDPLVTLATLSAVTETLRLGTSVLQVSIRNPVLLAREIMTAHLIAGDRLSLGLGAGSTRSDFEASGQDYEARFRRFGASVVTVRRLLRGEEVDGTVLTPFEATLGGPPLLIGSWGGSRWIPRAATEFDGWIASARHSTWATIEQGIERFRDAGGRRAVVTNLIIDPAQADGARDDAETRLDACGPRIGRERVQRLRDLGFDEVVVRTWDHTDEVVGRLASLVR